MCPCNAFKSVNSFFESYILLTVLFLVWLGKGRSGLQLVERDNDTHSIQLDWSKLVKTIVLVLQHLVSCRLPTTLTLVKSDTFSVRDSAQLS